ncbi:site-specific integrase [Companilactobacillus nantensis]|uniref:Phage integrase n=1 Tax=Companilactobacillus nantensis DSM 16982 TaxID=1423774 RepID=A0A0R1WLP0_9LACO|nr:site-specific integrase [Companilactobacillus nantensis]KRM15955.1 phage integrase [Companilactobacillus nantensis DSM 16982]GEO64828.1 site-specific integrase [Companilactobacillus nantensis]
MSSITKYKLKNGKELYRVQYTAGIDSLTNKPARRSKRGFKTQRDAKLWMAKTLTDIDMYGFVSNPDATFKEVYESFSIRYAQTVKSSTYNRVEGLFKKHILPVFGKKQIKKITISMCQEMANKWSKKYVGYSCLINYTSRIFNEALISNIVHSNPMKLIVFPKGTKKDTHKLSEDKFWDKSELQIFLSQSKKYYSKKNSEAVALFRLLAFTGMRKGELIALQVKDFSYKNKTLVINKTLTTNKNHKKSVDSPKTENGTRTIYLDQNTANILNHWIHTMHKKMLALGYNTSSSEQLLFPSRRNSLMTPLNVNKWMDKIINSYNDDDKNEIKLKRITPHGLRHTWITMAVESKKMTIKQIQQQVGDSDVSTILNIYTHVTKEASKKTIDSFTDYVGIE